MNFFLRSTVRYAVTFMLNTYDTRVSLEHAAMQHTFDLFQPVSICQSQLENNVIECGSNYLFH